MAAVVKGFLSRIPEDDEDTRSQVKKIVNDLEDQFLHESLISTRRRFDGRALDEVRALEMEASILPRTHGSALFQRGETQALGVCTLGTPGDMQIMDELEGEYKERFLLHYNFPGYSVGEVRNFNVELA